MSGWLRACARSSCKVASKIFFPRPKRRRRVFITSPQRQIGFRFLPSENWRTRADPHVAADSESANRPPSRAQADATASPAGCGIQSISPNELVNLPPPSGKVHYCVTRALRSADRAKADSIKARRRKLQSEAHVRSRRCAERFHLQLHADLAIILVGANAKGEIPWRSRQRFTRASKEDCTLQTSILPQAKEEMFFLQDMRRRSRLDIPGEKKRLWIPLTKGLEQFVPAQQLPIQIPQAAVPHRDEVAPREARREERAADFLRKLRRKRESFPHESSGQPPSRVRQIFPADRRNARAQ